jgi:hypothetical protein
MTIDDAEHRQQVDDAYRAIGRYFVKFSQLVHYMRLMMARRLTRGEGTPVLGEIATGEHGHFNVAQAFFTMCRHDNDLDDDEKKVESALRGRFVKINEKRTDYAHGDWWVGVVVAMPEGPETVLPPAVVRVRPRSSEPEPEKIKEVPVATLEQEIAEIEALLHQLSVFARVCLEDQIVVPAHPPDVPPVVPHGEIRVRDVLKIEHGKVVPGPKWPWLQHPGSAIDHGDIKISR